MRTINPMPEPIITVSAVVLKDPSGRMLTVRKRGTGRFMLPGGKPESGENPAAAAIRETREEVGIELHLGDLRDLGAFTASAANEEGRGIHATVFEAAEPLGDHASAQPAGEIAEVRWLDLRDATSATDLAPLLTEHVIPALLATAPSPSGISSVTIFTGARTGASPHYAESVTELAGSLAKAGVQIVYGGGDVGLMGVVADAALAAGGRVTGVIPQSLVDAEVAHPGLTELHVVPDMHARKMQMAQQGEAFVALPGGIGTLEELFEVWTWQQLGLHTKPVALYNTAGFWEPLLTMLQGMVKSGFLGAAQLESLVVADEPQALLSALENWSPPTPRWSR